MAGDRVPDVSDTDLAMYRAIVGGPVRKKTAPPQRPWFGRRVDGPLRLAQRRLMEGLKRLGFRA